jgi:hypothetical protein
MQSSRRDLLRLCALPAILVLTPAIARAQGATPAAATLPASPVPFELATVPLPDNRDGVAAMFAALPEVVLGEPRQPLQEAEDRLIAAYGRMLPGLVAQLALSAINFSTGDFFPGDFTAGDYVTMASATPDMQATAFGRDGDLVWIQSETTVGVAGDKPGTPETTTTLHTLAWGTIDVSWLFSAAAIDPAGCAALAIAFVAAAESALPG